MTNVASAGKIAFHHDKIQAYLRGEPIFPVTLEMDITSQCTRVCQDCPSCRSPLHQELSFDFIDRLFASFEGQTRGLLLTGGEPTMSPLFPSVLALARKRGFEEIAVVTNGSLLHQPEVAEALMRHATTIRVSMYDWDGESCGGIDPTLRRIEQLRTKINHEGASLKIGISALTAKDRAGRLAELAGAVKSAGADWIYFHPMCTGWEDSHLRQTDQAGVLEVIEAIRGKEKGPFQAFVSPSRYDHAALEFSAYHAAHFLLVVGADGLNYLGAEVKYQKRFAIADVAGDWSRDFLQKPDRLARIAEVNSGNYSALLSRHRGVLYNDYIEKLKTGHQTHASGETQDVKKEDYWFSHIL